MLRVITAVAVEDVPHVVPPRKGVKDNNRVHWEFEEGTLFQECKEQIIKEVDEMLKMLGMTRLALAKKMSVQAAAVTQSLALDKGLQLTTLVRMADALGCDVEVNFVRRGGLTEAVAERDL